MTLHANVGEFLLDGKDPHAIALRMLDGDHTYGEVISAVAQCAKIAAQTESPGSRVVLIGDNSLFWVASYLGSLGAGLVCVPVPANIAAEDLAYISSITGARTAFVQSRLLMKHEALFERFHIISEKGVAASAPAPACFRSQAVQPQDLAAVMFTSGSTGKPRGVMVSHRNIIANTESIIQYLELNAKDRTMAVLPFHYCFGTSLLHTHLKVGASLVIDPRFSYPEAILQRMESAECTGFAGVPSHFQILLRRSTLKRRDLPHLRYVQQAGGHLAPVFVRELRQALPRTKIFLMYGQTEATARLSYLPPEFLDRKAGSIGKGIPGVRLQVLDPNGRQVAPGEVGEIVAEGVNITHGYWCESAESAQYFREGRLYTGDLATVDEDGFLYITDRVKDFLKCGGERVSSRQIEEQLLECPEVLEAAVIGVPDDVLGESAEAFLVLRSPFCTPPCRCQLCRHAKERIADFCKEHLPLKLVPKLVIVKELPKNSAGKVVKATLKSMKVAESSA